MRRRRERTRGQSVVELALVIPVLLILTLTAIDFGRVFLGWVNLQQMTRIAANEAAEHASVWAVPGAADPTGEKAKYQAKVMNDARLINCKLPNPLPDPVLGAGTALGAPVTVGLSCEFGIITPIISNVIGKSILVSAETTYPVKEGVVATVPGGGAPIIPLPVAKFIGSPQSGWGPLPVTFTNQSTGAPTSQNWNFNMGGVPTLANGATGGSASPPFSTTSGIQAVTYTCGGAPNGTCTFSVSLTVANAGGSDPEIKLDYITVKVAPLAPLPIADFTATPRSGLAPLTVAFSFVDLRAGTVTYTRYDWDLDGNGTFEATGRTTSRTYPADGVFDISLRVTDSTGATSTETKRAYIVVTHTICTVPDFANINRNDAQRQWDGAQFTTRVQYRTQGNYLINYQSITGGTIDPQPSGCDSVITVGP